jgi:hypothetical protein
MDFGENQKTPIVVKSVETFQITLKLSDRSTFQRGNFAPLIVRTLERLNRKMAAHARYRKKKYGFRML